MEEKLAKKKKVKKVFKKKNSQSKVERKKPDKTKRGRIFIKNLPFKLTEEELKDHFSQFGDIVDLQLLKKSDGKLKGCGFINFDKKISAVKAILKCNKKSYKDRTISVDWAVPKSTFEKSKKGADAKEENGKEKKDKVEGNDNESDDEAEVMEVDNEEKPDLSDLEEDDESKLGSDDEEKEEDDDDTSEEEDDDDDDDESITDEIKQESDEEKDTRVKRENINGQEKKKVKSNDVTEGKTVFLRNVPFHIDNNRLKQLMVAQFGQSLMYALVCMDSLTEHSKGTAFVKFKTVEQAEACVGKGSMTIDGETVTFHAAMDRKQLDLQKDSKDKKFKDSRNLYLVKEGVVLGGSRAAADVSVTDMQKRVQLEQWKTQMLRNLHMFVSKTRLIVHNLPPDWNDNMLRAMFKKHCPPKAVIREAKVMRNIREVDESGQAKSKEHGFVSFTTHEDALQALRNVNNNPTVFTRAKRPIVAFSIENRAVLNAKMKRTERSKEKNPLYREKYLADKKSTLIQNKGKGKQDKQKYSVKEIKQRKHENGEDTREFKGQLSKPSQNITFPKKHKLNKQLEAHKGQVQKAKKEYRQQKKKNMAKAKTKDPVKTKQNMAKKKLSDDKHFNKLISSYKTKISTASAGSTPSAKRWYET